MTDFIVSLIIAAAVLGPVVLLAGIARLAGFADRGDTRRTLILFTALTVGFALYSIAV